MKILITGGSGYIGSLLVPKLLNLNHKVIVIDNFAFNQTSLLPYLSDNNFTLIKGDARDSGLIKENLKVADVVMPLAALVGAPVCENDKFGAQTINFDAVKFILDNLSKSQYLIFPNTNSGYGVEDNSEIYHEESTLRPHSIYGRLKQEIEDFVLQSGNGISYRLATVFGLSPCLRLELLVNDFTYKAVKEKCIVLYESGYKRNFLHVQDAAEGFIFAMNNYESMNNNAYNIGIDNNNLTKLELCELIADLTGDFKIIKADIFKDPDQRDYAISHKKLAEAGFITKIGLSDGIQELIKAYRAFPEPHNRILRA